MMMTKINDNNQNNNQSNQSSSSSSSIEQQQQQQQQQHNMAILTIEQSNINYKLHRNNNNNNKYADIEEKNGGQTLVVNLHKNAAGLGISLAGNRDRKKMSIFICGMHPKGSAFKDGRLCIGDEILEVNGIVLYGRSHLNASAIIKNLSCPSYKFIVLRRKGALDEMAVKPLTQFPLHFDNCLSDDKHFQRDNINTYKGVRTITMRKTPQGLGIAMVEGKRSDIGHGIFVADIQDKSSAKMAGLNVGDMILSVNQVDLIGADHDTATNALKHAEDPITMVIVKPSKYDEHQWKQSSKQLQPSKMFTLSLTGTNQSNTNNDSLSTSTNYTVKHEENVNIIHSSIIVNDDDDNNDDKHKYCNDKNCTAITTMSDAQLSLVNTNIATAAATTTATATKQSITQSFINVDDYQQQQQLQHHHHHQQQQKLQQQPSPPPSNQSQSSSNEYHHSINIRSPSVPQQPPPPLNNELLINSNNRINQNNDDHNNNKCMMHDDHMNQSIYKTTSVSNTINVNHDLLIDSICISSKSNDNNDEDMILTTKHSKRCDNKHNDNNNDDELVKTAKHHHQQQQQQSIPTITTASTTAAAAITSANTTTTMAAAGNLMNRNNNIGGDVNELLKNNQQQQQQKMKSNNQNNNNNQMYLQSTQLFDEIVTIELARDRSGLGIRIVGGSDTSLKSVIVHDLLPNGAAYRDGRLKPGDMIIEMNGESLTNMTNEQARKFIRQITTTMVKLKIYRRKHSNIDDLDKNDHQQIMTVNIVRKSLKIGLGLTLNVHRNHHDSNDNHNTKIFIENIASGSVYDGKLMIGDQILSINNHNFQESIAATDQTTNIDEMVALLLKTLKGTIRLKIGRLKQLYDSIQSTNDNANCTNSINP